MTTETTATRPARLNARDLRRALAWAFTQLDAATVSPDEPLPSWAVTWSDLCAACGLTDAEMHAAIMRAVADGRRSIRRELRAQSGGRSYHATPLSDRGEESHRDRATLAGQAPDGAA